MLYFFIKIYWNKKKNFLNILDERGKISILYYLETNSNNITHKIRNYNDETVLDIDEIIIIIRKSKN